MSYLHQILSQNGAIAELATKMSTYGGTNLDFDNTVVMTKPRRAHVRMEANPIAAHEPQSYFYIQIIITTIPLPQGSPAPTLNGQRSTTSLSIGASFASRRFWAGKDTFASRMAC